MRRGGVPAGTASPSGEIKYRSELCFRVSRGRRVRESFEAGISVSRVQGEILLRDENEDMDYDYSTHIC